MNPFKSSIDERNYKIPGFKKFCHDVLHCMKCFGPFTMQKHYHFFDGSLYAPIMIIGQSPIYPLKKDGSFPFSLIDPENKHQYPGSIWLRKCFTEVGIDFRNVYLTNVVKDSPENNKVHSEMIKNCSEFLHRELKMFKGKVVLLFGSVACKFFNLKPYSTKIVNERLFVGCYHPQYVIRKGSDEREKFIKLLTTAKNFLKKRSDLNEWI